MSIEQEMLYLRQIKALFGVCAASDRLLLVLRRQIDNGLIRPEMIALETSLRELETAGFYDRRKGLER